MWQWLDRTLNPSQVRHRQGEYTMSTQYIPLGVFQSPHPNGRELLMESQTQKVERCQVCKSPRLYLTWVRAERYKACGDCGKVLPYPPTPKEREEWRCIRIVGIG